MGKFKDSTDKSPKDDVKLEGQTTAQSQPPVKGSDPEVPNTDPNVIPGISDGVTGQNPNSPYQSAQNRQMADDQQSIESGFTPDLEPPPNGAANPTQRGAVPGASNAPPSGQVVDGVAQDVEKLPDGREKPAENRQYKVIGGPDTVMYNGQRVQVKAGKIFTEHSVDLEHLRSQGVQLQLVPPGKLA